MSPDDKRRRKRVRSTIDRRKFLATTGTVASLGIVAGCTGGGGDGGDGGDGGGDGGDGSSGDGGDGGGGSGGDGGDGGSTNSGPNTFENKAGNQVGADFETVQDLAQDEGSTTFYATLDRESVAPLIEVFQEEFGVQVNHITGGSEKLLSRFESEFKADNPQCDAFVVGEPKITRTWENGMAQSLSPDIVPAWEKMPDSFKDTGGDNYWMSLRQLMASYFYNTDKVDAGAADDWLDVVTNTDWHGGNLGHDPTPNIGMIGWLRDKYGDEYFEALKTAEPRWVDSHTDLARFCGAGEFDVAFTYTHKMGRFGNDLPVDIFRFDPMPSGLSPMIMNSKSPNPNAGLLWYNWLMSPEGQNKLGEGQYIPVHPDAEYSGYPNIYPSSDYDVDTFFTNFDAYQENLDYWNNTMGDAI